MTTFNSKPGTPRISRQTIPFSPGFSELASGHKMPLLVKQPTPIRIFLGRDADEDVFADQFRQPLSEFFTVKFPAKPYLRLCSRMAKGGPSLRMGCLTFVTNSYAGQINLSTKQLKQVLQIRKQIDASEIKLSEFLGNEVQVSVSKRRRGMSAAGRKRMALAQKLRWAKLNAGKTEAPVKKRRKMSKATKAKMAEAAKKDGCD